VIVVFNPTSGARAELCNVATSADATTWSWRVAYKGREVLDGTYTLTGAPSQNGDRVVHVLAHAALQAATSPTLDGPTQDAIRALVREL
jgi:hypothetical protein